MNLAANDNPHYQSPPHIIRLNSLLLDVEDERESLNRLMVFMPPRHGKSELISKYFTAWYLLNNPDKRIILSSYEADFAATWGQHSRDILEYHGPDYNVHIDDKSSARNRWNIRDHRGGMMTAGVGGAITGKGADVLVIDDPVKNAEEANSPTMREKAWDWFQSTAYTRLEPDGCIILIMTRWHEDDLAGRILRESGEDWTVLSLPAINDNNEALWPERFPIQRLEEIRRELGSYWFNSLYQQTPQPAEGGLLKREWLNDYTRIPQTGNLVYYQGWDLAISEKTSADYTCSCTLAHDTRTGMVYIVDWTREHIDFPRQVQRVKEQYTKYQPALIGIEDVAYQRALPQQVQRESTTPLPLKLVPRVSDKVTRIVTRFSLFENGTVHVPKTHPLYEAFEEEFLTFNKGAHDDLLDATELALSLAMVGGNPFTESSKRYDYGTTSPPGVDHVRRWRRK